MASESPTSSNRPSTTLPELDLIALLETAEALLFARARLFLADVVGDAARRLVVGRAPEPGEHAVTHADGRWSAVDGDAPSGSQDLDTARLAVARAAAALMLAEQVKIDSALLALAGIVERSPRSPFTWELTADGQRLRQDGR